MEGVTSSGGKAGLTRREFVQSATAAGLMMTMPAWARQTRPARSDQLAVGIIGTGSQGQTLIKLCLKDLADQVRFVAVCDIWPFWREYAARLLARYEQPVSAYEDYREMLASEKHLDAVIIATPDWVHAEQTIACLRAGKHVYCEKEMSNTVAGARQMVEAARQTGKLLQIGHQRRSNPRYWHALKMIDNDRILGRITHAYGQWNRARLLERGWPKGKELDAQTLRRYGYDSMNHLRNWRWYRKYGAGPIADLGSHQIDIFNWFLHARPQAVLASAGVDYYADKGVEWYDNVMAIYEYHTGAGPVRAFYQVLNTTSQGGYYEQFMGDEGALVISDDPRVGHIFREVHAKRRDWEAEAAKVDQMGREAIELKIGETLTPEGTRTPEAQKLLELAAKDSRTLHLANFFDAIHNGTPLNCPAKLAFETCVSVLKVNEAIVAARRLEYQPEEFVA